MHRNWWRSSRTKGYNSPMDLSSLSGTFSGVPVDWIVLLSIAVLFIVDAMRSGASRAISLSLALPITYVVSAILPKTAFIGTPYAGLGASSRGIALLIILAVISLIVFRMTRDYSSAQPLKAILTGLATAILLAVFWIQMPGLTALWQASEQVTYIFGAAYSLFWLIASYLALAAVRR